MDFEWRLLMVLNGVFEWVLMMLIVFFSVFDGVVSGF